MIEDLQRKLPEQLPAVVLKFGKEEMIRDVAKRTCKTQREVKVFVEAMLDSMYDHLTLGYDVSLFGICTLRITSSKKKKAYVPDGDYWMDLTSRRYLKMMRAGTRIQSHLKKVNRKE